MGRNLDRGFESRNETRRSYDSNRSSRSDNVKSQTREAIYRTFSSGGKKR